MSVLERLMDQVGEFPPAMDPASIDHEADRQSLHDLTPVVDERFAIHMKTDRPWYPHLMIPGVDWVQQQVDIRAMGELRGGNKRHWDPEESPLPEAARVSLEIGLLTEDNLPGYFRQVETMFGNNESMTLWNRRWTAEESRHSIVMRNLLERLKLVDLFQLQDDHMEQMSSMDVPDPPSIVDAIIYVTKQELATMVTHQRTGMLLAETAKYDNDVYPLDTEGTGLKEPDPEVWREMNGRGIGGRSELVRQVSRAVMTRVSRDEGRHYGLYGALGDALFEINPSLAMKAVMRQFISFQMPGKGIPDFGRRARIIADAEVYDIEVDREQVSLPMLGKDRWDIENVQGLDDEGKQAQEYTVTFLNEFLPSEIARFRERRDERRAADPDAVWVGKEAA
jgi:acyl-[acyl-carrier-protein] desaturase